LAEVTLTVSSTLRP